jgi:DNA-binding PadR family transcriptional regulator
MAETLGTFEQAVLLAILRLKEDAYGRGILREVQERLKREIVAGAVHATLERLEGKGLIRMAVRNDSIDSNLRVCRRSTMHGQP